MSNIPDSLKRIDGLKAELDGLRPLDRELEERVLQKLRLWWTYHSNAIEGNKLTRGETEMFLLEGLTAKGKPLKDHLDLQGHSNAINYLLAFVRENEPLTEAMIRKLHQVLLVEPYQVPTITPDGSPSTKTVGLGEYKTQPNHVKTRTGEIHYYASPIDTPMKMHDLVAWQREVSGKHDVHPVEVAARFHHEFTAIHPFDDGNGRMARLLMNLLLMKDGYPPVVIRLGERDDYLAALRRADAGDSQEFCVLIAERVAESIDLYLRAAKGEEIHEPTDIEKEIALLKLGLQHIEEPQALTQKRQKIIFERSFDPLFKEIKRLVAPLAELFTESSINISGESGDGRTSRGINAQLDFGSAGSMPTPPASWEGESVILRLHLAFQFNGFKKARFDAFDLMGILQFQFEKLKYQIDVPHANPKLSVLHFYQEQLTADEITDIAQKLARSILEVIKDKTTQRR